MYYRLEMTLSKNQEAESMVSFLDVYQLEPEFSAVESENIEAGTKIAKIKNLVTSNPCVIRYYNTTNTKAKTK